LAAVISFRLAWLLASLLNDVDVVSFFNWQSPTGPF
jgi:hypothetical protein